MIISIHALHGRDARARHMYICDPYVVDVTIEVLLIPGHANDECRTEHQCENLEMFGDGVRYIHTMLDT